MAGKQYSSSLKRSRKTNAVHDSEEEEQEEREQVYDDEEEQDEGTIRRSLKSKTSGSKKAGIKPIGKSGGGGAASSKGKGKGRQVEDASEEEEEEEAEDDEEDEGSDQEMGTGKKGKNAVDSEEKRELVRNMTRYILFSEYSRKQHSRNDIVKAVMPDRKGRYFNELLPRVQTNLRNILGMELVCLRAKETSSAKNPAKVYALRSNLPLPLIRALATRPLPSLSTNVDQDLAESSTLARELATFYEDDPDGDLSRSNGNEIGEEEDSAVGGYMRDVKKEEGAAYGILGVILALILVNGKVLGDDQLITWLRKLNLTPSSMIPLSPLSAHTNTLDLHHYILLLCRQGYLERSASASAAAPTRAGQVPSTQRTTRTQGDEVIEGGDAAIEYRWGARSEIEIGEVGVAEFIKTIFEAQSGSASKNNGEDDVDDDREDEEDEEEEEVGGSSSTRRKRSKQTESATTATTTTNALTKQDKKRKSERLMIELKRAAGVKELQDAMDKPVTL